MIKAPATLVFLISLCLQITAQISDQKFYCSTSPKKSEWLTKFQHNPEAYEKNNDILYIPLTIHILGTDNGEAYYPMQNLLDDLCYTNTLFAAADIQFFMEGEVLYINNSSWLVNPPIVPMMNSNNVENTVNVYYVNDPSFGGFYSDEGNGVVVSRRTLTTIQSLLAHELGHSFSLPHTLHGWEASNYFNYSSSAPAFIGGEQVERVDGSNCNTAADGFCDTPPDYLWLAYWNCLPDGQSPVVQRDPTGATFQSDGSLIMSYSNCGNRFSPMQIQAMRANITDIQSNLLYNQNPPDNVSNEAIGLINPAQGTMINPSEPLLLEWEAVPNATQYLVHLTFLPYFSTVYDEYLVEDTTLTINTLAPNKNYRWRVRPYHAFHTCVSFSQEGQFSTGDIIECDRSEVIGTTLFDNQSNGSVCNRISQDVNGNIMATWTQGFEAETGYPNRGTGYNRYDAAFGTWQNIPTERLESNTRTGWPNHIITDNGTELIVNHVFTNQGVFLHSLRRTAGNTNWVESQIPTNTPRGVVLARMVASGETVHLIAIATPTFFGGLDYQGVDRHLLYYRSPDGGATWEVVDGIIPGLDNSFMKSMGFLDCYAIDAREDVVAIGLFSQINDVLIFKSIDGGHTWNNTRVQDFPIDMYQLDQGYTITDLPFPPDPQLPNPFAILTTDNSGSVLVDKNGIIHTFYGQMYFQDNTANDGITLYQETDGIAYWNESFGSDSIRTVARTLDLDGNGSIDVDPQINLSNFSFSMTSTPSPAVDENNNLYLAYSMVMEGPEYRRNDEARQYRHIMVIHSQDGGESWSEPFDAIEASCFNDPDHSVFTEAFYPSMVRDIEDEILFLYLQDFNPGTAAPSGNAPQLNFIRFVRINVDELGVVKTEEVPDPEFFKMQLYPNPATDMATLSFELEKTAQIQVSLFNLMGQQVFSSQVEERGIGENMFLFNVGQIPAGIYLVQLKVEEEIVVARLVVA